MRINISISANVYNLPEVDKFLSRFLTGQDNIDKWVRSTLRTYMLNEAATAELKTLPKGAPDWAKRAFNEGTLVNVDLSHITRYTDLEQDLEHAIGWLKTFPDDKVFNVSVKNAIEQGNLLIERQNKRASSDEGETRVLYTFPDGYTIVECLDPQSLKREGKLMGHCVGNEGQSYIKNVEAKRIQVWSLRDLSNGPHCTFDYKVKEKRIAQIKGKQNKGVIEKYVPYVKKWLEVAAHEKLIHKINEKDLINIGVVVEKGVWYDVHNLPEGLTLNRSLDLSRSEHPIKLPDNLTITEDLDLHSCKTFTRLPENLKAKSLNLSYSNIEELPVSLKVASLNVRGCTRLKELPNWKHAPVTLSMAGSSVQLPAGFTCRNLDLHEISGRLPETATPLVLPEGLKVDTLALSGCNIKRLPTSTYVKSSITLESSSIEELPDGLTLTGQLNLKKCVKLKALPKNLRVGGLSLSGSSVTVLPSTLIAGFVTADAMRLSRVEPGLTAKSLSLQECSGITSLPDGLKVESLDIRQSSIKEIPLELNASMLSASPGIKFRRPAVPPTVFPDLVPGQTVTVRLELHGSIAWWEGTVLKRTSGNLIVRLRKNTPSSTGIRIPLDDTIVKNVRLLPVVPFSSQSVEPNLYHPQGGSTSLYKDKSVFGGKLLPKPKLSSIPKTVTPSPVFDKGQLVAVRTRPNTWLAGTIATRWKSGAFTVTFNSGEKSKIPPENVKTIKALKKAARRKGPYVTDEIKQLM